MRDVIDGKQLKLFNTGEPKRARPSQDEIGAALQEAAKIAVAKRHRGRPPRGMTFEELRQEVRLGALPRVSKFMHGGPKTLFEFTYLSCCHALCEIQREHMRSTADHSQAPDLPLFELSDDGHVDI